MKIRKTAAAVCAAFLFAGCSSSYSKGDQMYEKYGKLIDALEAGDYDCSVRAFNEYLPQPETEEVTLTKDNLFDYYELDVDVEYRRDDRGRVRTMLESVFLKLRPEFENIAVIENGHISYEYVYRCYLISEMDPEEGTYVCAEAELPPSLSYMSDDLKLQSESNGLYETGFVCFYDYVNMASYGPHRGVLIFEDPEEYSAHYVLEPSDITFTDVRGTLKIRK